MVTKNYTAGTRLQSTNELKDYFDAFLNEYNCVYRRVWRIMTSPDFKLKYPSDSLLVSKICKDYCLMARTVNSIVRDIKGRMKALLELKKLELYDVHQKICKTESQITGCRNTINKLKTKVADNKTSEKELKQYRKAKQNLFNKQRKLNRLRHKEQNLNYIIDNGILKLGFGGKKMFQKQYHLYENGYKSHEKWYYDYVNARDKNIFYLGSSNESCGNQQFQMTYNPSADDFTIQIRKEMKYCDSPSDKYIVIHGLKFKHLTENIINNVRAYEKGSCILKTPLTCRIRRIGRKLYLQIIFHINAEYKTNVINGTIGLDFNDGFIELSETNREGNLVCQDHLDLHLHGKGNSAKSEMEQILHKIVDLASKKGKDICIEDLNFTKKKSKTSKAKSDNGKQYNKMIHTLDYSRYTFILENIAHRYGVRIIKVNPAYTTQIGKQKFAPRMKLNPHQAASYTIARRGQGFKDKLIKTKPRKLAS